MSTSAQILANRENSKLSTGPRTPDGKAASSLNHVVHGLAAVDPVLPHEDRNQFNALLEQYKSEWAPITSHQQFLVAQMAGARWKLDRAERIEIAMFGNLEASDNPEAMMAKAMTDKESGAGFDRLQRYRAGLERTYHRCIRELRASQKAQNEANSQQMAENKLEKLLERLNEAPPPVDMHELRSANIARSGGNWKSSATS
jgi:hypothetical protein